MSEELENLIRNLLDAVYVAECAHDPGALVPEMTLIADEIRALMKQEAAKQ